MINLEEIQVKHIAPVEYEDGIVQLLIIGIEGVEYKINAEFIPAIVWVHRKKVPYIPMRLHCKSSCNSVYVFTEASVKWWSKLTGINYDPNVPMSVCACEGKILE